MPSQEIKRRDTEIVRTNRNGPEQEIMPPESQITEYPPGDTGLTSMHHTESYTGDPYAERRARASKLQEAVYLLFGIVEALIGIRFVLRLLAANPAAPFANFVYVFTAPLVAPFAGLFGSPHLGGMVFDWNALVAIVVYALIGWVLAKAVWLAVGETRTGTATHTSHVNTHRWD